MRRTLTYTGKIVAFVNRIKKLTGNEMKCNYTEISLRMIVNNYIKLGKLFILYYPDTLYLRKCTVYVNVMLMSEGSV